MYIGKGEADPTGVLEAAFLATIACEPIEKKLREAVKSGAIEPRSGVDTAATARDKGILTAEEFAQWQRRETLRRQVIKVDDFPQDFGRAEIMQKLEREQPPAARAAA
jgi:acyl-CoA dehydrogenase